jgi:hypothetical protein
MSDPQLLIDTAIEEYNSINYDSITDPCGLARCGVDPGRVAIVKGSIINKINQAKVIGELELTVLTQGGGLRKKPNIPPAAKSKRSQRGAAKKIASKMIVQLSTAELRVIVMDAFKPRLRPCRATISYSRSSKSVRF